MYFSHESNTNEVLLDSVVKKIEKRTLTASRGLKSHHKC